MQPAITIESLSKRYRIRHSESRGSYRTLREDLVALLKRPWSAGRNADEIEDFWALRDLSLEVHDGEVLGVIGNNGAGKSTLLKILSRITKPTSGQARIRGRIGSLLEVGTGFHPELSGRENIFLSGAILGMSRREISAKFDEIVQFSGVERFLDTPAKRYSSGMYVRLAFAVAAHLETEILLVDEVLAVGDAEFQKKCLGKMNDLTRGGRTVLFVSHNMAAIQSLCDRVLWIDAGAARELGDAESVSRHYLEAGVKDQNEQVWQAEEDRPGNEKVRLRRISVRPAADQPFAEMSIRTPLVFEVELENFAANSQLLVNLCLLNARYEAVFVSKSCSDPQWRQRLFPAGVFRFTCSVPGDLLNDGKHYLRVIVFDGQDTMCEFGEMLSFTILDSVERRHGWLGGWRGAVRPELQWTTEKIADAAM